MIRCACGENDCKIEVRFEQNPASMWFTDADGKDTMMYLDANTIVRMITELREALIGLSNYRIVSSD